jgi:hypothetical protein
MNKEYVLSPPDSSKIDKSRIQKLHDGIRRSMSEYLLDDEIYYLSKDESSYCTYSLLGHIDDLRKIAFSAMKNYLISDSSIGMIHYRFSIIGENINTSNNQRMKVYLQSLVGIWNEFVNECNQ